MLKNIPTLESNALYVNSYSQFIKFKIICQLIYLLNTWRRTLNLTKLNK